MSDQQRRGPIEASAFEPLDSARIAPARKHHPLRWTVGGAIALFALAMLFLFSARSLEVHVISETPADVDISGLALPFGGRYLLLLGEYQVQVSAEGYLPLETSVEVGEAASQRIELELQPLPGRLNIASTPAGAQLLREGENLGRTPLQELKLEAGIQQLRLEAERYRPLELELDVTGRDLLQEFSFELEPAWAEISLASEPADAEILVDGERAGNTPASIEIIEGQRQLILRKPGHADWVQSLAVTAGEAQDLGTVTLQPAAGVLQLDSEPTAANVTLDGEFQGQTPLQLELSPGREHRLSVFKPGYRRHSETLSMQAAEQREKTLTLQAQLGEVELAVSPAEALVKINGREIGRGNRVISLPATAQQVEISLPGHETVRKSVTPRPGFRQRVAVNLRSEADIRAARTPATYTNAVGQTLLLFRPGDSPTGDFTMGASRREPGRRANEVLHPVALRRPFYLQTTEVTNAQFRQFTADHNSGQIEGNSLNRDKQPAVQVSWQQAASFCNWLSRREGLPPFYTETRGIITGFDATATGYRLPSEAEWAWAARSSGAQLLRFPWGDDFPPKKPAENYADNSSAYVTGRFLAGYEDGHIVSAPVASFAANPQGLYDMGGNVAEWVNDVYGIPATDGAVETDPLGGQSGDNYVLRGAGWSHSRIGELRLSYRDYGQAGRDDVGFRIARYAE